MLNKNGNIRSEDATMKKKCPTVSDTVKASNWQMILHFNEKKWVRRLIASTLNWRCSLRIFYLFMQCPDVYRYLRKTDKQGTKKKNRMYHSLIKNWNTTFFSCSLFWVLVSFRKQIFFFHIMSITFHNCFFFPGRGKYHWNCVNSKEKRT